MKSTHPRGQRFSWRSHRSGRQTRSEVICLTPLRFRPLQNYGASRLSWPRALFLGFFRYSFVVDFDSLEIRFSTPNVSKKLVFCEKI